jgi:hypothetical protein
MAQTRKMKSKGDFFDFVIDAQKNRRLSKQFFSQNMSTGADDLFQYFKANGYDIPMDICQKLIDIRDGLIEGGTTCDDFCEMILEGRGY